jgi:hypothetical protein
MLMTGKLLIYSLIFSPALSFYFLKKTQAKYNYSSVGGTGK